ncbi:MAG: helix-turn-helix domain-containing protein [Streptosporangiaceae bacterium]
MAAVTELAGSPDVERVALAHVRVGSCSRVAGEAAASAEAFQRAVGLLADRPPPAKATVMARYAGFLMVGQRVRQGLAAVEAALDLARRTGSRRRAAQLALATGHLDDARAHIAAALAISDRCDDMIYAPKACSVGISAEAACPAPDLGTVEALTTRLSGIEAMARSFGGQLLAEPAAFAAMARAEARELSGGPQPEAWQAAAAAWDHCGDQYWSALCRFRTADALLRAKGDRNVAARIAAEALAAARSLGAAPLAADLEVLSRRGRLPAGSSPDKPPRRLGLTEREAEVLDLLAEGRTNRQIGDVLFISEKTVSVHVTNLLRKLGVDSRREAAEISRRLR